MGAGHCEYADRQRGAASLRCALLKKKNAKWDFCIKQFYCRASGAYKVSDDAANCKIRNEGVKADADH